MDVRILRGITDGWCLWSPGGIRHASAGFPLFDLHFDGKMDTAACSEIIAHSSRCSVWVVRRGSVRGKGPPRGCGQSVGGSAVTGGGSVLKGLPEAAGFSALVVDRSVWVTSGGSVTLDRGTGYLQFSLVSTLLFWVTISQVGIKI